MAVTRRYFDRTPGVEGDVGETTRIINNYSVINEGADAAVLQEMLDRIADLESLGSATADWSSEIFDDASGVITPTDRERSVLSVASTAGAWTLDLSRVPQRYPAQMWVVIDSSGAHTPTFPPGTVWVGGSAPASSNWATGKRAVIRFTRIPSTSGFEAELVSSGDTPATNDTTVVDPPDLTFNYSTSSDRSSLTALGSATLSGEVAVVVGPLDADIKFVDLWHNHSGTLPAAGSEDTVDSYIGRRLSYPYDLLGGTTTAATMWDTLVDPTGNNRDGYNPYSGTGQTIRGRVTYIDDTTAEYTSTFSMGNPSPSSDPIAATYSSHQVTGQNPTFDMTVPSGSNRAVVAVVAYRAVFSLSSATLGGNAMTLVDQVYSAGQDAGIAVFSIPEASMPASGTRTLAITHSGGEGVNSITHFHCWAFTDAPDASVASVTPVYENTAAAINLALPVDASSFVALVGSQAASGTLEIADDWDGTAETGVLTDAVLDLTSRAEWKLDAGAAGAVSVELTPAEAKAMGVLVSLSSESVSTPPPSSNTPGVPVLTTPTKPGDNQLKTTWEATSSAVSYEGRIGTSNPPTTSTIALGDVLEWTRSGLAPSTEYFMQVRAVSSAGDRSAWSTAVSATTNASDTVVEPIGQDRFAHGNYSDIRDITNTFGTHRTDGVLVPNWWHQANLHSTAGYTQAWGTVLNGSSVGSQVYNTALSKWANNASARPAGQTAIGQRAFLQIRLSKDGHPKLGSQPSNAELALLDMARSGSKGTDNRNADWREFATNLAGWPGQVFIGLSHESNGSWYSNYSGVNPNLVGSAALAGVSNSRFGTAMSAAVRQVAVDGNCAPVHKLAFEHAAAEIWSANPGVIICYTLSGNASSAPPGDVPSSLSTTWQDIAHPDPEFFDVFGITQYCRGSGRPVYDGSGSVDDHTNYTFQNFGLESTYQAKSLEWNRPVGFWELGTNWDVFDWAPTFTDGPTDNQSSAFWKRANNDIPQMDFAFVTYWHAGGDRKAGSTYQLPEANYGYQKTSGTSPKFPKTLATLRDIY